MKVVILAGGFGSRLAEETVVRPKPMVEIGGKPILWHIMNIYAAQGVNEFVVALGYKARAGSHKSAQETATRRCDSPPSNQPLRRSGRMNTVSS